MIRPGLLTLAFATWFAGQAKATILLELDGGYLKAQSSSLVTNGSGLLLLVVSTQDSVFDTVTTSSLFNVGGLLNSGGDDYVLFKSSIGGDGDRSGVLDAGEFQQVISLALDGNVTQGDPVMLFWFPSLTSTSTSASEGTYFGTYRSSIADTTGATDVDGSSPWYLPSDGTSGYSLLFLTSDAGSSINTASSGVQFGQALSQVAAVPEPASSGFLALGAAVGFARRRGTPRK